MSNRKNPRIHPDSTALEAMAREFDQPDHAPRFAKAPAIEQKRHGAAIRRAKRKQGRPAVGAGSRRVQITVERTLLAKADRAAKIEQISRSELIARGLKMALAS